jgi:non-ribosomal peptide synthase protein (TIGR01720 family)
MSTWLNSECLPVQYLPLTSAQIYNMDEIQKLERPGWYTVEFLLKTKAPMNVPAMKESIYYLVDKYETMRVRFFGKEGQWVQEIYPLSEADPFASHDLSNDDPTSRMETMKSICMKERDGFVAEEGNLIRILFFKFSETEGRLWFSLHHVISDFGSVFMLWTEFLAAYDRILQGRELKWQTSIEYRKWMYLSEGYIRDILLPAELGYWVSRPWHKVKFLPSDYPEIFHIGNGIADAVRDIKTTGSFRLDTYWIEQDVITKLFDKFGADVENFLLAVFFLAVAKQRKVDCLHMKACNSGRYILPAEYGINVSKVLGCLAVTRVMVLEDPDSGDLLSDIQHVLGQVKDIPSGGAGFFQIEAHIRKEMEKTGDYEYTKQAEIYFNYMGRVDSNLDHERFELVEEDTGLNLNDKAIHGNLLDLMVGIDGNRMILKIFFCEQYFADGAIEEIMSYIKTMSASV